MTKNNFTKIEKVVVNVGLGKRSGEPQFQDKILPSVLKELGQIIGQRPKTTAAKKSIAGFKTRAGQVVGLMATLRGKRAKDFLVRLNNIALPRVKDFRGIDLKSVDQNGNLNIGMREHLAFPEINAEESFYDFGFQITVVPKVIKTREEAIDLYRELGVPLKHDKQLITNNK